MSPWQLWDSAQGQTLPGILAPLLCLCGPLPPGGCESCRKLGLGRSFHGPRQWSHPHPWPWPHCAPLGLSHCSDRLNCLLKGVAALPPVPGGGSLFGNRVFTDDLGEVVPKAIRLCPCSKGKLWTQGQTHTGRTPQEYEGTAWGHAPGNANDCCPRPRSPLPLLTPCFRTGSAQPGMREISIV